MKFKFDAKLDYQLDAINSVVDLFESRKPCDKKKLTDAINAPKKRTPETAQLLHLLDGLGGHSRQLGMRMLVYDIPFDKTITKAKAKK